MSSLLWGHITTYRCEEQVGPNTTAQGLCGRKYTSCTALSRGVQGRCWWVISVVGTVSLDPLIGNVNSPWINCTCMYHHVVIIIIMVTVIQYIHDTNIIIIGILYSISIWLCWLCMHGNGQCCQYYYKISVPYLSRRDWCWWQHSSWLDKTVCSHKISVPHLSRCDWWPGSTEWSHWNCWLSPVAAALRSWTRYVSLEIPYLISTKCSDSTSHSTHNHSVR